MRALSTAATAAAALSLLWARGTRAADTPESAPEIRPFAYLRVSIDRALDEPPNDSEPSITSANPTDADSLRYLHGSPQVTIGYSQPILPRFCLDARVGYAQIMAVQGGPRAQGFDLGVAAVLHLLRRPGERRGLGLSIALPLAITIPTVATEPEARRAVAHSVDAHVGWSAGGELSGLWYIERSVVIVSILLVSRWNPFTWSTWLENDPAIRHSTSYGGQHTHLGVGVGYGWTF